MLVSTESFLIASPDYWRMENITEKCTIASFYTIAESLIASSDRTFFPSKPLKITLVCKTLLKKNSSLPLYHYFEFNKILLCD